MYADIGDTGAAGRDINRRLPRVISAQLQDGLDVYVLHVQVERPMVPAAGRGRTRKGAVVSSGSWCRDPELPEGSVCLRLCLQ